MQARSPCASSVMLCGSIAYEVTNVVPKPDAVSKISQCAHRMACIETAYLEEARRPRSDASSTHYDPRPTLGSWCLPAAGLCHLSTRRDAGRFLGLGDPVFDAQPSARLPGTVGGRRICG